MESVYVHAPFCARRCFYCDFAVHVRRVADHREWTQALQAELSALEAEGLCTLGSPLLTLYVGGGTPSLLGSEAMQGLAEVLGPDRLDGGCLEWTAEANPESLTPEVARAWRAAGVTRLSLGVQSFEDGPLRWMGRLHGARGALEAIATARAAGFENLSVDLTFGLPPGLDRSWSADLDRVIALGVPHVSLYGLTVEKGTPLERAVAEGRERVADEDQYRSEFLEASDRLVGAGYVHYEVSNFAFPGWESRHNRVYWEGSDYLGMGNGAHSYLHPVRRWNLRDWTQYQEAVLAGRTPLAASETLDRSALTLERIWLGLRTNRGIALDCMKGDLAPLAQSWEAAGWAERRGESLTLTPEGWLVMDRLTLELDACQADGIGGNGRWGKPKK